jgi:serine O-acetyltransferase
MGPAARAGISLPAMSSGPTERERKKFMRSIRSGHPCFLEAALADAAVNASNRGERHEFRSRLDAAAQMVRLAVVSDAYAAQLAYRAKARLQALGVPLLPRLAHRVAMTSAQVSIGDPVVIEPGVYVVHGQIVIDGLVKIATGVTIGPFVTIGLRWGNIVGPTIGRDVKIGTGAKVIGPITVGAGARIGANAVVVDDVAPGSTVAGSPARPIGPNTADTLGS